MQLNCCVTHVALNESFSSRVCALWLCALSALRGGGLERGASADRASAAPLGGPPVSCQTDRALHLHVALACTNLTLNQG